MSKFWRTTRLPLSTIVGAAAIAWTLISNGVSAGTEKHSLSDVATTAALAMQEHAQAAGYSNVDVSIRPLDSRLNLAVCDQPLNTLPASNQRVLGPVSAGIRCDGPQPWTLYVRGQVSAQVDMPVLAASVARGDVLSQNDISIQSRRLSNDNARYITEIDDIIGKQAKRALTAGTELRYSDLKTPIIVERGQMVSIVSGGAGLRVSMQGKALASGGSGDRIMVANVKTGKRVEGVVARDGSVMIQ